MKFIIKPDVPHSFHFIIVAGFICSSLGSCSQKQGEKPHTESKSQLQTLQDSGYAIGDVIYAELASQSLQQFASLNFDSWGKYLSDDVEYFFPDGDDETRTKLTGKASVLSWWQNWKATSGITSMTITEENNVPVVVIKTPKYAGLTGNWVFCWFNNAMVINEKNVGLRMNVTFHFNHENLIDRCFTYYDRTEIIQATGGKISINQ